MLAVRKGYYWLLRAAYFVLTLIVGHIQHRPKRASGLLHQRGKPW